MKAYIKYASLNTILWWPCFQSLIELCHLYLFIHLFTLGLKHVIKYNTNNTE